MIDHGFPATYSRTIQVLLSPKLLIYFLLSHINILFTWLVTKATTSIQVRKAIMTMKFVRKVP